MTNYLKEIHRMLRKDKKCFITFFVMNEQNKKLINDGKSWLTFNTIEKIIIVKMKKI
jgi:hypothetical protein